MKTCKKLIAIALVLMLAMAVMAPSAFAADYPSTAPTVACAHSVPLWTSSWDRPLPWIT